MDIGQRNDASRSSYQGQRPDSKLVLEKQGSKDPRDQAQQEDMELGYEDNAPPQTFEGLEQKFIQDIMKLTKEQQDAEDTENARHREVSSIIILRKWHISHVFGNRLQCPVICDTAMFFLLVTKKGF